VHTVPGPIVKDTAGMAEHLIRLRGGWEWTDLDAPLSPPGRIILPATRPWGRARRIRLCRRFGRPPIDARTETLFLRLDKVSGLESITINDALIAAPRTAGPFELPLADSPERNVLILELSLPAAESPGQEADSVWGEIALVVRSATP
jgi:hypothetical protein